MSDPFATMSTGLTSPASDGAAITPSDSEDLAIMPRAIYVGGAGDVTLVTKGGTTLTFVGYPAGSWLDVRAARVKATGTTATDLIGVW